MQLRSYKNAACQEYNWRLIPELNTEHCRLNSDEKKEMFRILPMVILLLVKEFTRDLYSFEEAVVSNTLNLRFSQYVVNCYICAYTGALDNNDLNNPCELF